MDSFTCQCATPGYCPVWKKTIVGRLYHICKAEYPSGQEMPAETRLAMLQHWADGVDRQAAQVAPSYGAGTELAIMFSQIGLQAEGCSFGCESEILRMNMIGPEGCRKDRANILANLRKGKTNFSALDKIVAGAKAATLIPMRHWLHPLEWLVDEAIRRVEKKAQTT